MASVAARYDELKELGAEVLSCSVDSEYSHKIWQEEELSKMVPGGVPYPMLSDKGGRIGRLYGVYDEEGGVNIRGRFLIDPDGIIQAMEVLTPPVGRNFAELVRQLKLKDSGVDPVKISPFPLPPTGERVRKRGLIRGLLLQL